MSRIARAGALSLGTGVAILALLRFALLPAVAARLNADQGGGWRDSLRAHPYASVAGGLVAGAVLCLPVLLIGLWGIQAGPFRPRAPRR